MVPLEEKKQKRNGRKNIASFKTLRQKILTYNSNVSHFLHVTKKEREQLPLQVIHTLMLLGD